MLNIDIIVVKASHLQPFIFFLDDVNAPVDHWLELVGLNRALFSHPENLVPEAPFWAFLDLAANHKGLSDIGFQVTETLSLDSFGVFGAKVMNASTLHQAILCFIENMGQQSNCPVFWLEESVQGIWFYRLGTQGIKKGQWPIEQHVVSLMIQLIRGFTSTIWTPPFVHLQTHTLEGSINTASFKDTHVTIGKPYTGVFIPKSILLNKPITQATNNLSKTPKIPNKIPDINNLVLEIIITQSNFKVTFTADHAAKCLGMSTRQMQRILKNEKSSFRVLSEQVLLKQAKLMLTNTNTSILFIAFELGYSDAGNFTRAFKRWVGVSPSQFRRELFADNK